MLKDKILILDGGLGTLIQSYQLTDEDFGGKKGCNDYLCLTRPDVIEEIHRTYVAAGADIISTNSFNSTGISLSEYGLEDKVYDINYAAAQVARRATEGTNVKVAGSIGPTSKSLSMSPDVERPAYRALNFEELANQYALQIRGLIDGGVDIILLETVFDTLNAKAAIFALRHMLDERNFPLMISGTITDQSGRILSGQTIEAFYESVKHARPMTIGLNCAFGAKQLKPYIAKLSAIADCGISAHPNAGLPNVMGGYDESAAQMGEIIETYLADGIVNIIGGCCGTTPEHIRQIALVRDKYRPREITLKNSVTTFAGLEPLYITSDVNFINIGERTNVAGSAKFARLIRERKFEEAIAVAQEQVEGGASVIDVCMDAALIDGTEAMVEFLNLIGSEPGIARLPVMIDSSSWGVLEAGLQTQQGKAVVNSISLKEGEVEFLCKARLINDYGAAAVVMLFDEEGQADSYERKIMVAERAYKLLVNNDFCAENIVFDPNILAIATGMPEHDRYGVDFIEACRWIKTNCPGVKISGGISNLSFSFRGNNAVREAMHSIFLYHAINAGLDMAIVNPSMLQIYDEIEPQLKQLVEDVVLNRDANAAEKLINFATENIERKRVDQTVVSVDNQSIEDRIITLLVKGQTLDLETNIEAVYQKYGSALEVIDQVLMVGMGRVGELFSEGKMFLPQVVKSARVMKKAVEILNPYILSDDTRQSNKKILFATVKGDVHDIGKNICSIVLKCNGYDIEDMGVMAPAETITRRAIETNPDVVLLSGLITPSLEEMRLVAKSFHEAGLRIPIAVGGATTSALHTAVKIAPAYEGLVVHSTDASSCVRIVNDLLNDPDFELKYKEKQARLRELYEQQNVTIIPLEEARNQAAKQPEYPIKNLPLGREIFRNMDLSVIARDINWNFFFAEWNIGGRYPEIFEHPTKGSEARKLYDDAQETLKYLIDNELISVNIVKANVPVFRRGDDIVVVGDCHSCSRVLPQLRNQTDHFMSVADFIDPKRDVITIFALAAKLNTTFEDDYQRIMAQILCDRLASALSEQLQDDGLLLAFGYPTAPDHSLKRTAFELLDVPEDVVCLSENYVMNPTSAVCGMVVYHPEIKYFKLGIIGDDQIVDYCRRAGLTEDELRRNIPNNIK